MDSSSAHRKTQKPHRETHHRHRRRTTTTKTTTTWCCSFKTPPKSPEIHPTIKKPAPGPSCPSSPQSSKSGLGLVGRILSPGRVSPIDPNPVGPKVTPLGPNLGGVEEEQNGNVNVGVDVGNDVDVDVDDDDDDGLFDVRLSLKGKNGGGFLVLEVNSSVLADNSPVFGALIEGSRKGLRNGGGGGGRLCRIEVPEVENLGVFRDTIELMFECDITKKLIKIGAFRAILILEVSVSIKFNRGVVSCLKYLEAVPWTEEEEEKLRKLFAKFKFDAVLSDQILSRLNLQDSCGAQQKLASRLVHSITSCSNTKARNELKSMVKGLLSKSSVYEKDHRDITKDDLYSVLQSCLSSLVIVLQEASGTIPCEHTGKTNRDKRSIESISWQVDNINWLLEILLDRQIAEDFVDLWANQKELLEMHERASPMVRYELSRVSAVLFVAMGTRKLQCAAESRIRLIQSWFGPMLLDFGWLQRCRKGLDVREMEEAMGQALLTLPLKHQYGLFMEWFKCFSKHGTECPNLSKAFQIWWRRSFLRGSETHAIETR